jgi:chemotaxis protein MotC
VKRVRRVLVPPLPRLRPTRDATAEDVPGTVSPVTAAIIAEPAVVVPASVRIVGPAIGLEVTGSTEPAAPAASVPAPAPVTAAMPPPVEAPAAPPPTDDIPGDPAAAGFIEPPAAEPPTPPPAASATAPTPLRQSFDSPLPGRLPDEPYRLVRLLQSLQDRIAAGSTKSLVAQRSLRQRIDERFLSADPAVWRRPRNAEAAVTYALSGGRPDVLKRLIAQSPRPAIDMRLVVGALAYVEGREVEARDNLLALDAMALPPSMGAAVALAQSALVVRTDPARAIRLLDTARLLAPGTLVEEAALRREIFVADQTGEVAKLESLVGQYLRRFRHSVYAGNFRVRLAAAISRLDFGNDTAEFGRLDEMLALIEPAARCELYLTVALASLVKGKAPTAALAASRALDLAPAGSAEASRSHLYAAAALAVDPKAFDAAVASLKAVDRGRLPPSDAALYEVVAATADAVASGTARPPAAGGVVVAAAVETAATDGPNPLINRANEAIRGADELLARPVR